MLASVACARGSSKKEKEHHWLTRSRVIGRWEQRKDLVSLLLVQLGSFYFVKMSGAFQGRPSKLGVLKVPIFSSVSKFVASAVKKVLGIDPSGKSCEIRLKIHRIQCLDPSGAQRRVMQIGAFLPPVVKMNAGDVKGNFGLRCRSEFTWGAMSVA
ncbi:hypothetical protein R1flu_017862 [Riccia fluitans]|uniref:Uncharacterized protein n=1 Tax=Riccia fluitans TaxID=41844 RepID=A0ABD1ZHK9_9MARC